MGVVYVPGGLQEKLEPMTLISLIPRIGSWNETHLTVQLQCKHMRISADTARSDGT